MYQKLIKTAEALGIDTNGKSQKEIMELISKAWEQEKTNIEQNSIQEFIDNGAKRLPEIKKQFEKPFEIWLEKVQNGKKPECLTVVGYNPKTSSVIVVKKVESDDGKASYKLFQVEEKFVITSIKRYNEIIEKQKADRAAARATPKPKANKPPK